jgi:5-methylcytosine-specific restriction endonuclease McrA
LQEVESKNDPGSKQTGIALVGNFKRGKRVIYALNLEHRGHQIKASLDKRRANRRSRRHRHTRYRAPRFDNRCRAKGWLPPSLVSRVQNVFHWNQRLMRLCRIAKIAIETVRFDMQKMVDPEISGLQYQQGELLGYEVREYLLEKWQRNCAYCSAQNVPLEIEHIVPKSKGGTDRVSNLALACRPCNLKKGSLNLAEFVTNEKRVKNILQFGKSPLKDAAAVNSTRIAIGNELRS